LDGEGEGAGYDGGDENRWGDVVADLDGVAGADGFTGNKELA